MREHTFFVLRVDIDPDVWVRPLQLHDRALHLDGFGSVELRGKRVMCRERYGNENQDNEYKSEDGLHMGLPRELRDILLGGFQTGQAAAGGIS
jgi:hypothetical protein